MTKNSSICVLWMFSWAIAHSLGLLGPVHFLGVTTKTSSFLCFMDVFMSYCPQYLGSGVIYNDRNTQKCLRAWQRSHRFHVLCPFSWAIDNIFVVTGGFAWPVRSDTCFRLMSKNSSFSHLIVVFMNYCPQIWHTRAIYNDIKTRYMFEDMTKNSSFSCFMTVFMSYTP